MSKSRRAVLSDIAGPTSKLSFAAASTVLVTIFGAAGRFALQIVIADMLGTSGYGRFVALRTWGEMLATFPNRGYHHTTVRYLPEYETGERWPLYRGLLRHSLRLTLVGGIVLAILFGIVGSMLFEDPWVPVALAAATIPAWAAARMLQSILQAQHQFATVTFIMQLFQPGVLGVGLVGLWLLGRFLDVDTALALLLLSVVAAAAVSLAIMQLSAPAGAGRILGNDNIDTDLPNWRDSARRLYASQLAIAVIGMADILILDFFVADDQLALYSIASRIAVLGRMANSGLESIVAPRIASGWANGEAGTVQRLVQQAIAMSTIPTLGLALFLVVFRGPVLGIVGEQYREAGSVLVILLIGNVVNALTGPSGYVVSLTGHESAYARIMVGAAVLLVVGSVLLAGPAGIVGVAVARTVTNVTWNLALVAYAKRNLGVSCYPVLSTIRRPRSVFERTSD